MRVAMFEGYGYGALGAAASDPRVEDVIRQQVQILQGVQAALWKAHGEWQKNRWLSGLLVPASVIARWDSFDWKYAVTSWQSTVDTFWGSSLTDAVRGDPYAVGSDGKTRLQSWIDMGSRLITWAENIAKDMNDDTLLNVIRPLGEKFVVVARNAISAGVNLAISIIPGWIKWTVVGAGVLFALYLIGPRRR